MELRTEIEIERSADEVWAVLSDFAAYGEWNPFIPRIAGEMKEGARLEVLLCPPEGSEFTARPLVLRCSPGEELRWLGHLWFKGLFDGEHFFKLVALSESRTRFVQGENFTGLLVKPLSGAITKAARGFVFMNQALKRRVEGRS